jgi:hypothetical protein
MIIKTMLLPIAQLMPLHGEFPTLQSVIFRQRVPIMRKTSRLPTTGTRKVRRPLPHLKPSLVDLYNDYLLNNDAISAADKQALNLYSVSRGGNTPSPSPSTTPIVTLSSEKISVLHVIYSDPSTPASHAKPKGVAFCELWYKIDGAAPTSPEECTENCFISRTHDPIVFSPTQRGKTVFVYARWVNRNGKTGPWSGLVTAIIP